MKYTTLRNRKKLCTCGRKALFRRRGQHAVRWRADHPLCFQCFRSLRASTVARALGAVEVPRSALVN